MAASNGSARLFLALWPRDETRAGLARLRDRWSWTAGAAPTPNDRLHLTLHFIGTVADEQIPALAQALATVRWQPFTLQFRSAELWPRGIAVACPQQPPEALWRLEAELCAVLRRLALPVEERPFRPHVTLARKAQGSLPPAEAGSVSWPVQDGFALVQSLPGGAGYRVLWNFC